jgi:hypothetical protein
MEIQAAAMMAACWQVTKCSQISIASVPASERTTCQRTSWLWHQCQSTTILPAASDQMLDAASPCCWQQCSAVASASPAGNDENKSWMQELGARSTVLEHCHAQGQLSNVTPVDLSRKEQQKQS